MHPDVRVSLHEFDDLVAAAYRKLFPGDPDKTAAMLDWRMLGNPHGPARFVLTHVGDDAVGMIALIPTKLRAPDGETLGYQAIDAAVDPAMQGRGLFTKMGSFAQEPGRLGGEILWGFPNASAAPGWFGRLGWANYGEVPLLMRPLRFSFFSGRLHHRLRRFDFRLVGNKNIEGEVLADPARCSDEVGKLWNGLATSPAYAVRRDSAWLRWRLMDKPGYTYRCAATRDPASALDAFVATRITEKHGGRLCYVMEAIALPGAGKRLSNLLASEIAAAERKGAEVALAWCPKQAPNYSAFRRAGFVPIPARLRPIEINFGARALTAAGAPVMQEASWYISFLDSDTN